MRSVHSGEPALCASPQEDGITSSGAALGFGELLSSSWSGPERVNSKAEMRG